MSFRPESLRNVRQQPPTGQIDYRLVRKRTVDEFRRGRLSRLDVCDAQPELMRAARNCGNTGQDLCPICQEQPVVLVSFVFGPRLPAHGRCVTSARELDRLSRRVQPVHLYLVEVCPGCAWNHLLRTFPIGGRPPARSRAE